VPTFTPTPPEKQSHVERNIIIGGAIAGGLLAAGLFCFFHHKKKDNDYRYVYESDVEGTRQDELTPLSQGPSSASRVRDGYSLN
jgi:hypothetical protein